MLSSKIPHYFHYCFWITFVMNNTFGIIFTDLYYKKTCPTLVNKRDYHSMTFIEWRSEKFAAKVKNTHTNMCMKSIIHKKSLLCWCIWQVFLSERKFLVVYLFSEILLSNIHKQKKVEISGFFRKRFGDSSYQRERERERERERMDNIIKQKDIRIHILV